MAAERSIRTYTHRRDEIRLSFPQPKDPRDQLRTEPRDQDLSHKDERNDGQIRQFPGRQLGRQFREDYTPNASPSA